MDTRPIDRALLWAKEKNLNQSDLARLIGALPQDITNWKKRGLPTDRYADVAAALGRSVDELIGGQIVSWSKRDDLPASDNRVWIDRWDYAFSAGNGGLQWEVRQKEALPFNDGLFISIGSRPKNCRLVIVRGDSMEPFLFDRDMIMIDISKTEIRDGKIYAVHFENEALVKQLFKQAGGALTLHSYNNRYPDRRVEPDEMSNLAIAGEVVYRSGSGFI